MATISTYKLDGVEYTPPREMPTLEVLATFDGDSVQANITTSEFSFVNDAAQAIDNFFAAYPTEGMPLELSISNETNSYSAFTGYLNFRTLQYKSDIERICGIKQDNGLPSLDERLRGITMELLQQKGAITTYDFCHIPYIVENRKTTLEKVSLLAQLYVTIKTGYDEIHKILNIASDITSAGVAQALINLTVTLINLVLLIQQLVNLWVQIRETFFPPIRYHKGISMYNAILKAVSYCGYDLQTGFGLTEILQNTKLCPSKTDEIGLTNTSSTESGILKPNDFGFVASDLFELANMMFYTKVAIIGGNTVVLRSYNDPYWVQSSSYIMPDVKIEQAFVKNGMKSVNYDELKSSRIIQYSTDSSDLWTMTNVNEQISVTTVTPVNVISEKRVLLTGSDKIKIPYSLAVRKDPIDELLDLYLGTSAHVDEIKQTIEDKFNEVATILAEGFPVLANLTNVLTNRIGCMKVENHYFSNPKIVYLDPDTNRIPDNYVDIVGAIALNENYHSYKSFVPGVRNSADLSDTNSKHVYTDVTIPFGIDDFNTVIDNSFFTTVNGEIGKFTSVKWIPEKDYAVTNFWIQNQWATNIEENTI
jgi:hypothetical protein